MKKAKKNVGKLEDSGWILKIGGFIVDLWQDLWQYNRRRMGLWPENHWPQSGYSTSRMAQVPFTVRFHQTWQLEIRKWRFIAGKIIYKCWLFQPRRTSNSWRDLGRGGSSALKGLCPGVGMPSRSVGYGGNRMKPREIGVQWVQATTMDISWDM
jgi:hypothetical protein